MLFFVFLLPGFARQQSSRTWPRGTEGFTKDCTMHCGAAGASALRTTNATEVVAKRVTLMPHCAVFVSCSRGRSLSACIISASGIPRSWIGLLVCFWSTGVLKKSARVLRKNLDDTCAQKKAMEPRIPTVFFPRLATPGGLANSLWPYFSLSPY